MKLKNLLYSSVILLFGAACVDIQGPMTENLAPHDVLAKFRFRSSAIMIAEGDSMQLDFALIATSKDTMPFDPEKAKWTSSEVNSVTVSKTGVIYGHNISDVPIRIIAQYQHNFVTKLDTVDVYVTEGRLNVDELRLVALDSTRIGGGLSTPKPRVRVDLYKNGILVKKGAPIPLQVDAPATSASDRTGGSDGEPVHRVSNEMWRIGKFWVRSSVNLYGTEVNDSLQFTGLYGAFMPGTTIMDIAPGTVSPAPILDTIVPIPYQLCAVQWILNLSKDTVDIVYSDSTASSTGCEPYNGSLSGLGPTPFGKFIGGNVLNVPPNSIASRQSRTTGIISFTVRKSSTKEIISAYANRSQQIDVPDQ